ncbi:hypothetical protein JOD54_000413 [Actinokineospora baliensis]|nr:hypothetical protein [Actinokineospora baliensis]
MSPGDPILDEWLDLFDLAELIPEQRRSPEDPVVEG